MLDRGVLEELEQDVRKKDCNTPQLTQLECILLCMYRGMSETDQNHLRRLAEMMTQTH